MVKKVIIFLIAVVIVFVIATIGGSVYMLNYSLSSDVNRHDTDSMYNILYERYPYMSAWVDSMKSNDCLRDTFVTMPSGERHHAMLVEGDKPTNNIAVVVHGYKDSSVKFLYLARLYNKYLGCNVLLPDLHGHGLSEGDDIQMGWKDREDILAWIGMLPNLFGVYSDSINVVVHGVSMGAATTMNVSGESTPAYVRCFVEDCGYTSVWDEFSTQLDDQFSLPDFPLLYATNILCDIVYDWTFDEASPLKQMSKSTKPMLFIHGDKDTFVPSEMVYPLYKAHVGKKKMWIGQGSEHALSYHDHEKAYIAVVKDFVSHFLRISVVTQPIPKKNHR